MGKSRIYHEVVEDFKRRWEEKRGETYYIVRGRDHRAAETLVEMNVDPKEYAERVERYLSDDRWGELCNWSFNAFVNNFNQFARKKEEAVVGTYGNYRECETCKKKYWTKLGHYCEKK